MEKGGSRWKRDGFRFGVMLTRFTSPRVASGRELSRRHFKPSVPRSLLGQRSIHISFLFFFAFFFFFFGKPLGHLRRSCIIAIRSLTDTQVMCIYRDPLNLKLEILFRDRVKIYMNKMDFN